MTAALVLGDRDGSTYDRDADRARLNKQALAVYRVMLDHRWHTLAEISARTDAPEASVSARLRDLRKARFGAHTVDRMRCGGGLWAYRLTDEDTT